MESGESRAMRGSSHFLSSVLLIFPEIVFGSSPTNSITLGYLYGAVRFFTKVWISFFNSSVASYPFTSTIVALTTCPLVGSGTPVTAHSSTAGCSMSTLSISNGPMR